MFLYYIYNRFNIKNRGAVNCIKAFYLQNVSFLFQQFDFCKSYKAGTKWGP